MTVLKASGVDGFLRKPDPAIAAMLVYGDEPDAVRDVAARAVKKIAGSLDDPFAVTGLQDGDLSGDPGRLADEVGSLSMFGGTRVIWIKGAEAGFLKSVMPVLEGKVSGNFIVAEAEVLAKSSGLRIAFEKSPRALIVPLYEADTSEIAGLVESLLRNDKLAIGQDGLQRFIELVGTSRGLVKSEVEKLALYCMGQSRVTVEDVEAVCGNDTGASPDELTDSVFLGDAPEADRLYHALTQAGTDAGRLLNMTLMHALRLQEFKLAIERGMQADQALRSARPPVFFKRLAAMQNQLRWWPLADLLSAGATLNAAILAARQNSGLASAIAHRSLLSLARRGQALRQDRG